MKEMKFPKALRIGILSLAIVCCLLFLAGGCKKSIVSRHFSPEELKQQRLAWNLKTTVEVYNKVGDANSAWDESARAALSEFSRMRSGMTEADEPGNQIIVTNCEAAIEAGCHDPLIDYLNARFGLSRRLRGKELADRYCDVAIALRDSGYPPVRKFYAGLRAVQDIYSAYGREADQRTISEAGGDLKELLLGILDDKTLPPDEMYEAVSQGLAVYEGDAGQYDSLYHEVEKKIFANWPGESTTWLLKGEGNIQLAWNARGSGYVDTVTAEGWIQFSNRLSIAEEALDQAWKLNTNDVRIPTLFLKLELGQGEGRERMEIWFQRAMEIDPSSYDACWKKMYYLEPKWYGSASDMIAFGRECVNNPEWKGRVPLVLVDAHIALANYLDEEERAGYWKRPEVWPDIDSAYKRFFEVNPEAVGYYHNYAWYAYHCEQWDALNKLIPKLGPINYDFFGGADAYADMLKQAREHAKK